MVLVVGCPWKQKEKEPRPCESLGQSYWPVGMKCLQLSGVLKAGTGAGRPVRGLWSKGGWGGVLCSDLLASRAVSRDWAQCRGPRESGLGEGETGPLGGTLTPLGEWVGKSQRSREVGRLSTGHHNGKKRHFEAAEARAWVGRVECSGQAWWGPPRVNITWKTLGWFVLP